MNSKMSAKLLEMEGGANKGKSTSDESANNNNTDKKESKSANTAVSRPTLDNPPTNSGGNDTNGATGSE